MALGNLVALLPFLVAGLVFFDPFDFWDGDDDDGETIDEDTDSADGGGGADGGGNGGDGNGDGTNVIDDAGPEIVGTEGADLLSLPDSETDLDVMLLGGDDVAITGAGDDSVSAGAGADFVTSNGGDDTVDLGTGDDSWADVDVNTAAAGSGDDDVLGGDGTDFLVSEGGADSLEGGAGEDTLVAIGAQDDGASVTLQDPAFGELTLPNPSGEDAEPDVLAGDDDIDVLVGDDGDSLTGGAGDDRFVVAFDALEPGDPVVIEDFTLDEDTVAFIAEDQTGDGATLSIGGTGAGDGPAVTEFLVDGEVIAELPGIDPEDVDFDTPGFTLEGQTGG